MDELHGAGAEEWKPTEGEREMCDRVERRKIEARVGRAITPRDCDPLTWELLIVWERREAAHERLSRSNLADLVAALTPKGD